MLKWTTWLILGILSFPMHSQQYTPGIFMCLNPSGQPIPLNMATGTPSTSNPPFILAYGMNSDNQAVPIQCDQYGNIIVTASGGTINAGTTNYPAIYTGSTSIGPGPPIMFPGQTTPSQPASGNVLLYANTTQGITRLNALDSGSSQPTVLGRDNLFIVQNGLSSPINAGQVVYISGSSSSNIPVVGLAQANITTTSPAVGITYSVIGPGAYGYVIKLGILYNINTVALGVNPGNSYFLSCTSPGGLTGTRPVTPCYSQKIGTSLYSSVFAGAIDVSIDPSLANHDSGTDQTNFAIPNGGVTGPSVAPSGACTINGQWAFSSDGHATFCNGTTWITKI